MRFSALNWWLEPALLVLVCIVWGALLANVIEHPAAAALKRWLEIRPADARGARAP